MNKVLFLLSLIAAYLVYLLFQAYQKFYPPKAKENSLRKYKDIRDKIKTGDVFAFQGKDLGDLLIKIGTHSQYTHVGMILKVKMPDEEYRIFFIQADDEKGVVLVRLSSQLLYYNGNAHWLRLKLPEHSAKKNEDAIYDLAMKQLGKGYDFIAIEGFVQKFLHLVRNKISPHDNNSFICSQLVAWLLRQEKLIAHDINPADMSPGQIVKLGCFEENIPIIGP